MSTETGVWHIGILVDDIDEAIARWSALTGWTFTEVIRYHPDSYVCKARPEAHGHDERVALSNQGNPMIELLEVNPDEPTHDATQRGLHHICFEHLDDLESKRDELAAQGIGTDGEAYDADGNLLLFFADKDSDAGFKDVRVEFIGKMAQPVLKLDGSPYDVGAVVESVQNG